MKRQIILKSIIGCLAAIACFTMSFAPNAQAGIAPSPFAGKSTNVLRDGKPLAQPILQPHLGVNRIEVSVLGSSLSCKDVLTINTWRIMPGAVVPEKISNTCLASPPPYPYSPPPKMIENKSINITVFVENTGPGSTRANNSITVKTELTGPAAGTLGTETITQLGVGQSKPFTYSRNISDLPAGGYQIKVSLTYAGQTEIFYFNNPKVPQPSGHSGFAISK